MARYLVDEDSRDRLHPSWDSSTESVRGLHASGGTRASAGGGAGRPVSPDDDLLSGCRCRYTAKTVLAPVLEDHGDGTAQALQGGGFRPTWPFAWDLWAVGDIPAAEDEASTANSWHHFGTTSESGAPDDSEAPDLLGGPSRTRTVDPLIKREDQRHTERYQDELSSREPE